VRQIAPALRAQGQRVSLLLISSPGQSVAAADGAGSEAVDHVVIPNMHYTYGRIAGLTPGAVRRMLPSATLLKVAEASLVLRRALRDIARRRGRIDLVEFPEETAFPALFQGVAPYAVKLHSSEATWRYFCGEGWRDEERLRVRLEAHLLRHARLVSAPSGALADHIAQVCGYPRARIAVLPYPMDLELFSPDPDADAPCAGVVPERAAGPEQERQGQGGRPRGRGERHSVLYVGRMDRRKGVEILTRAAEAILAVAPEATIDIVGGETAEVNAAGLLANVPSFLHRRIVFHGRVAHGALPDYYRKAAVCVVPSHWDNSPNTVYEAMGCGTPVVASRVGGIPELIVDGQTGLLVPPNDAGALATAVAALLVDPGRRACMGRAARERARTRFDPAAIAGETLELYRGALSGAGGPRQASA
jgi:glycosyltransferase involved in cell wall biosynthesis